MWLFSNLRFSFLMHGWPWSIMASCLGPLVYCFQILLNYLALQYFDIERTWWRLFQTWIVLSKFDIYVFFRKVHCLEVCQGFANTLWTETLAMGPHDNDFTNTLWTQTIVIGPYDKGFTNTFWTETLVMGPYDKGFTNTLWTQNTVIGQYDKGFTNTFWTETLVMGPYGKGLNTLWAYDPFLVNVYDNGTTNTMKRHKVCQGSTSTLYMFVWWCSRHFQQYFSSIGRSGIIGGGNRWTRRKPPICRKSLTNFIT
jgi:hypothetical protein